MATTITLSTSAGNVDLKYRWDEFEKGIDPTRGPWVKLDYVVDDWSKTDAVANKLRGLGVGTLPHSCPVSPNLYCLGVTIKGVGEAIDPAGTGKPWFNSAIVETTYGLMTYESVASEDPTGAMGFPNEITPGQPYLYMDQSIDFDTEIIKLPGTGYKFKNTPQLPLNVPAFRSVGVCTFTLVRFFQTTLPHANFTTYLNGLNDAVFLGQPKGQIKFLRGKTRKTFMSDGTRTQQVETVFKWREFDHNKQHRPDEASFDYIIDKNGAYPYTYRDLTQVLR